MFSTYYEKEVAVHQRVRRYFATGVKVSSIKEYEALFSKSNAAIETRKGLRKIFNQVCAKTDELILLNRFSVVDLKSHMERSEGKVTEKTMKADDTFSYWEALGASKEKVKTRAMYSSALDWFKLFRKDKPISLGAVDTAIITRFSKWLDEQKSRNGTDMPLSIDTRMVILRATRTVFIQAQKAGHTNLMRLQCRLSRSCVSSLMFMPRHIIPVSLFFRTSFSMR